MVITGDKNKEKIFYDIYNIKGSYEASFYYIIDIYYLSKR